jgi:hypothetical protein
MQYGHSVHAVRPDYLLHAPFAVDATKTSQGGWSGGQYFFCAFLNPDPAGNDHSVLGKASEPGTDALACIRQQPLLARLSTSILAVPPACGLYRATCGAAGPVGCLSGWLSITNCLAGSLWPLATAPLLLSSANGTANRPVAEEARRETTTARRRDTERQRQVYCRILVSRPR